MEIPVVPDAVVVVTADVDLIVDPASAVVVAGVVVVS